MLQQLLIHTKSKKDERLKKKKKSKHCVRCLGFYIISVTLATPFSWCLSYRRDYRLTFFKNVFERYAHVNGFIFRTAHSNTSPDVQHAGTATN